MFRNIIILSFLFISVFAKAETYVREYTYIASEEDNYISCRATSLVEVKRLLLEEVGMYIESSSIVENSILKKDEIFAVSAGITKTVILDDSWDGKEFWIKVKIELDTNDVQNKLNKIAEDRSFIKELKQQKEKVLLALKENERLRKELAKLKDNEKRKELTVEYKKNIQVLTADEYIDKGNEAYFKNDFDVALKNYEKAKEINPNYYGLFYNIGLIYQKKKNYNKAITFYNKAIEKNSQLYQAYNNLGVVFNNLEEYDKSIKSLNKAIVIKPDYDEAYNNLGNTFNDLKMYDKAIESYKKAIELNPNEYAKYYNLGNSYYKKKDYDNAILNYIKAAKRNPDFSDIYNNMGNTYYFKGEKATATKYWKKAAKLGNIKTQNYLRKRGISW